MSNKNVEVLVATHKKYKMPSDSIYVPIHVGAINKDSIGYERDDSGDNISELNPFYSELTALYYGWKNKKSDILGLVHYRRYFVKNAQKYDENINIDNVVLKEEEIVRLLSEYDMIVPKKRNYYIETLYSHYSNTLDGKHLDIARDIINIKNNDYIKSFDKVMKQKTGYMFNMLIAPKKLYDQYCEWLFPILEELKIEVDETNLSPFELRLYGRVSELLFNVWLEKNKINVVEVPFMYMDNISWGNKIFSFLAAKFFKKKYKKSF